MDYINKVLLDVESRYHDQKEFIQAVEELFKSIKIVIANDPRYEEQKILERLVEPDRIIMFRVDWQDDKKNWHINHGYRVQFNNKLGPYKGGLRFHPNVTLDTLKFLGFEQMYKNALTGLNLGGGKGGSDFDPKGKSDNEIKNFCIAFMDELYKYIGPTIDVPAGDIGVGGREISYLLKEYLRITNSNEIGVLTGKSLSDGGSNIRKEATGYGLLYFVDEMLKSNNLDIKNKRIKISGSGNVAIYAVEKAQELGAKIISISDSDGYVIDEDGIDLALLKEIKEIRYGRIKEYIESKPNAHYYPGCVWDDPTHFDIALPCAIQNDIDQNKAKNIISLGCIAIGEGANMPTTNEAQKYFKEKEILFAPAKAANAGGVAVSGLEMIQNKDHISWTREIVDSKLKEIMHNIHKQSIEACKKYNVDTKDYTFGSNVAGFLRVTNTMMVNKEK